MLLNLNHTRQTNLVTRTQKSLICRESNHGDFVRQAAEHRQSSVGASMPQENGGSAALEILCAQLAGSDEITAVRDSQRAHGHIMSSEKDLAVRVGKVLYRDKRPQTGSRTMTKEKMRP